MNEKFQMLKDVAVQTAKDSRAYGDGYRDGYLEALDDVEQIVNGGEAKPKKFQSERVGVSVPSPVLPVPCVRGIKMNKMKPLFLKLHEELTEFEFEIMQYMDTLEDSPEDVCLLLNENPEQHSFRIAEEGADVCTMVATILHAVGIEDKIRFDAQAYVNKHNHERGRN